MLCLPILKRSRGVDNWWALCCAEHYITARPSMTEQSDDQRQPGPLVSFRCQCVSVLRRSGEAGIQQIHGWQRHSYLV